MRIAVVAGRISIFGSSLAARSTPPGALRHPPLGGGQNKGRRGTPPFWRGMPRRFPYGPAPLREGGCPGGAGGSTPCSRYAAEIGDAPARNLGLATCNPAAALPPRLVRPAGGVLQPFGNEAAGLGGEIERKGKQPEGMAYAGRIGEVGFNVGRNVAVEAQAEVGSLLGQELVH